MKSVNRLWFLLFFFACCLNAQDAEKDYQTIVDSINKLRKTLPDFTVHRLTKFIDIVKKENIILELGQKYPDSLISGVAYYESGRIRRRVQNHKLAEDYFLKAKRIFKKLKAYSYILRVNEELLVIYSHKVGLSDKKKAIFKECTALFDKVDGYEFMGILKEIAVYYSYEVEDHKKAADYAELYFRKLDSLDKIYNQDKEFIFIRDYLAPYVSLNIGRSYTELGQYKKARKHLKIAEDLFIEWGGFLETRTLYNYYVNYFSKIKQSDSASYYQNKYFKANKAYIASLLKDFQVIGDLERDLEKSKKDFEIYEIKSKNDLLYAKRTMTINRLIITMVVVLFIFSVFAYNYNKKLKRKNAHLNKAKEYAENALQEKEQLESKIELINTSLTSDLHDNFGNRLSGILSSIDIMKEMNESSEEKGSPFQSFSDNLENSLMMLTSDVKDHIWANSTHNNNLRALVKRISYFAEKIPNFGQTKILVSHNLAPNTQQPLPITWNRRLLFIAKECITNALKYANAERVEVAFTVKGKNITLVCMDNGKGFDQKKTRKMPGLESIQNFAKSIGCTCQIDSGKEKGTTVTVSGIIE